MGHGRTSRLLPAAAIAVALAAAAASDYQSAKQKIELIQQDKASSGSTVVLKLAELNAFVRAETVKVAPEGVRDPKLTLGSGAATGFAYVDFPKLRQSQGKPMGWPLSWLLAGEKPVRVDARIHSSAGKATVELQRVEVDGVALTGSALDFVIRNYLRSYYPEAKVGEPFELDHRIERLDVHPSEVRVIIEPAPSAWRRVER